MLNQRHMWLRRPSDDIPIQSALQPGIPCSVALGGRMNVIGIVSRTDPVMVECCNAAAELQSILQAGDERI